MRWPQDATGWPMADLSRFAHVRPHRWHIQEGGTGQTILLIHGAGGATQSWRALFPILAQHFHVVAVDLPGQGFTKMGARARCNLTHMAEDLRALVDHEGWTPTAIVGHSAGAAIALRMAELGGAPQPRIIGINAALANFTGVAGWLFPVMAKMLAMNPLTASIFSATATGRTVARLITGTGSTLDADGLALYGRLLRDRTHVDATLAMMAQWSLDGLTARLPENTARTLLITGSQDEAVPPKTSAQAAAQMPGAQHIDLPDLGHLAHEEAPDLIADHIIAWLAT